MIQVPRNSEGWKQPAFIVDFNGIDEELIFRYDRGWQQRLFGLIVPRIISTETKVNQE